MEVGQMATTQDTEATAPAAGRHNESAGVADARSRRSVLAALVAAPLLMTLGSASSTASAAAQSRSAGFPAAAQMKRGGVRRFSRPFLKPGHRIVLPDGVRVIPQKGIQAASRTAGDTLLRWPHVPGPDGKTIDASVAPEPGAASQTAYLTGFTDGWYEITDARGRNALRVEWDAQQFPFLSLWQEWGASTDFPHWGKFYTVELEPFSAI
ncbi:hypothetical protein [Streptomyces sp. 7N604]|uniref:hypothetical protein n=1 Tax=Streptomyces sp. 7N604 TaxID=3457415 RepID=UPI003FD26765